MTTRSACPYPTRLNRFTPLHRRGVSTLLTLIFLPALAIMLAVVIEIGSLYVAKIELQHSLEAAALGGAIAWGKPAVDAATAKLVARGFAAANHVRGQRIWLDERDALIPTDSANANANGGKITLGTVTTNPIDGGWIFDAGGTTDTDRAVLVETTKRLPGVITNLFGNYAPNYEVHARIIARALPWGQAELVRASVIE